MDLFDVLNSYQIVPVKVAHLTLQSICSMVYPDANDVLVGGQGDLRGSPSIGGEDDRADFSGEAFQATSEWQDVKPGQVLPAGLHYR